MNNLKVQFARFNLEMHVEVNYYVIIIIIMYFMDNTKGVFKGRGFNPPPPQKKKNSDFFFEK